MKMGTPLSSVRSYADHTAALGGSMGPTTAARTVIGGEFEAMGVVEREMLRFYGLADSSYLIDVGCGSGRLAVPLAADFQGAYLGTDVVPSLIDVARASARRPDWRFEVVDSLIIPEADDAADMACFFSVFTHLLHEQTYLYLQEARRVLKPGGKIVFSFLEFVEDWHWPVFETVLDNLRNERAAPLTMFMDRSGIEAYARHLDLRICEFRNGLDAFIPLPNPVTFEGGSRMEGFGSLGQSVCVMSKP